MLNPSNNHPEQQHPLQPIQQLFRRHPFACLGGLWVTLVLVGGVATVGLVDPGTEHKEGSKPTPSLAIVQQSNPQQEVQQSKSREELPLLLFVAIALGCAGGSFMVTQALRYATQGRQFSRRSEFVVTVRKKRPYSATRPSTVPQKAQPSAPKFPLQSPDNQLPTTHNKRTQVTVLPREVRHPLDGKEESLADLLDLRKHHSLDSLLRTLSR